MTPTLTAMGGLLTRTPDGWRWRDGSEEPRVRDLTAAEAFQFPRVVYPDPARPGERTYWVSVPLAAVDEEPDLQEMLRHVGAAARPSAYDPGHVEVPEDAWDEWSVGHVIGVLWDAADEADLIATAEALRAGR